MRWTQEQARAIASEADTLLTANAGTGKTTTIVGKIRWLLGLPLEGDETGRQLEPCRRPCTLREIAAITFTEKAAYDLKQKLREELSRRDSDRRLLWQMDEAWIGTIHAFCARLLREYALRLGIDPSFRVLDENEARAAQRECIHELAFERLEAGDQDVGRLLAELPLRGGGYRKGLVERAQEAMRELRWHPDRCAADSGADPADREAAARTAALLRFAAAALERWRERLARDNVRDFDALVLDARDLLVSPAGKAARAGLARRLRVLIVDEFQDTDRAQWELVRAIARENGGPQLFLVGDPKQSIYRFRGADVAVWNAARRELEERGRVLELTRNFRCAPVIVEFVNGAAGAAVREGARGLGDLGSESIVPYVDLEAGVEAAAGQGVTWLAAPNGANADERRAAQGRAIARHIRDLVAAGIPVRPVEGGEDRPCHFGDIAVLYRSRPGLDAIETALAEAGIPYWLATTPRLGERLEVRDVLNALRVLVRPDDDLRVLGFLRSPFVALRDEVIAAMRLRHPRRSLLSAARCFLEEEWPGTPEGEPIDEIERTALGEALRCVDDLRRLTGRLPPHEMIEELLERTAYREHLLLSEHAEEGLANLQSLVRFCAGYADLDVAAFLEVWDGWEGQDVGIPQAPLYSRHDRVVTLSTIHAAKGLEWPIVYFVDLSSKRSDRSEGFLADPVHGPAFLRPKDERGPRERAIFERDRAEQTAEEARLLYVALTRARDRLIVVPSPHDRAAYGDWLEAGRADLRARPELERYEEITASAVVDSAGEAIPPARRPGSREEVERTAAGAWVRASGAARALRRQRLLQWLYAAEALEFVAPPLQVEPLPPPPPRRLVSATELMTKQRDEERWRRRFLYGVEAPEEFVARAAAREGLPPLVRGTLIHRVLERFEEEAELVALLEEAVGGLDDPELSAALAQHAGWRQALTREIDRVVRSEEWAGYVRGEHYRELRFLHLLDESEWRQGAFDLYRPDRPVARLIDFKTHEVDAARARRVASDYAIQARVYREAAAICGPVSVALHFTHTNTVVEMTANGGDGPDAAEGQGRLF